MVNLEEIKKDKGYHVSTKTTEFLDLRIVTDSKHKTPSVFIYSLNAPVYLGHIKFYGSWRKFVFYPACDTLFDSKCLTEIIGVINELQTSWKNRELN